MSTKKHNNKEEQEIQAKDTVEEQNNQTDKTTLQADEEGKVQREELTTEELLAAVEEENEKLRDQLLRQIAEFDNYRKRTLKEKAELILNGGEKTLSSLLPILDDLERAEKNIQENTNIETLKEGLDLVFKKFRNTLEKQGLKAIETQNQDFNTDFHEAIAMVPVTDGEQKGKIIDCVQTGYMLNDKVIRHAKVAVGQ
ncbi:co-chaperone GrpE [Alloprevotella rava F0323]|uniref:Protein GrpE n=1 Tax=Alloprevotella rava F0323 TaxID=679199 RepID=G5G9I6_9BACT|nr:nucleotide exchange factor GrpE [Alloprevotella rava]EHG24327.1 co-chaperone GrpE [Alloprevotella rava F0323]